MYHFSQFAAKGQECYRSLSPFLQGVPKCDWSDCPFPPVLWSPPAQTPFTGCLLSQSRWPPSRVGGRLEVTYHSQVFLLPLAASSLKGSLGFLPCCRNRFRMPLDVSTSLIKADWLKNFILPITASWTIAFLWKFLQKDKSQSLAVMCKEATNGWTAEEFRASQRTGVCVRVHACERVQSRCCHDTVCSVMML